METCKKLMRRKAILTGAEIAQQKMEFFIKFQVRMNDLEFIRRAFFSGFVDGYDSNLTCDDHYRNNAYYREGWNRGNFWKLNVR